MTPTLRKSEMPPDNKMRRQLYHGLRPADLPKGGLLVARLLEAFGPESDFARAAHAAGVPFFELPGMTTYEEYRRMAHARWVVTVNPAALQAGRFLAERHGMRTFSCCSTTTSSASTTPLGTLAELTGIPLWDTTAEKSAARTALAQAADALAGRPVAICQDGDDAPRGASHAASSSRASASRTSTATASCLRTRPTSRFFAKKAPGILVHPTTVPEMRFATPAEKRDDIVAIGQKAAFFTGATQCST